MAPLADDAPETRLAGSDPTSAASTALALYPPNWRTPKRPGSQTQARWLRDPAALEVLAWQDRHAAGEIAA
jgi:hypothetical protein